MSTHPTGREAVLVRTRLPQSLVDALKASAARNDRNLAAEIYYRLKASGPAEAATSPSHGPTVPKEDAANDGRDTSAVERVSSPADFVVTLGRFQAVLGEIEILSRLTQELVVDAAERRPISGGPFSISEEALDRSLALMRAIETASRRMGPRRTGYRR